MSCPITNFWYERGIELTKDKRTSLVVDPADGRIPYTPEFAEANRVRRLNLRNGFADHYTDRSLTDRCLMGSNAGPPMRPGSYNNNVLIMQAPGYVTILNEHIHNTRIIPVDGQRHNEVPQWSGSSRGHWEGETLVVETKNFLRETNFSGSSKDTLLVERFRRVDGDTLIYEFTIEDPKQLHPSVDSGHPVPENRRPALRVCLSRGQLRADRYPGRRAEPADPGDRGVKVAGGRLGSA